MANPLPTGPTAVIYVTGAPGTGKSTLVRALQTQFSNVEVFSYGSSMVRHLQARYGPSSPDELGLRAGTDSSVTIADIRSVDSSMVAWVRERQKGRLLLIDTHQVTLEAIGLRFVPFEISVLSALPLTMIWLLTAAAATVVKRITANPMGRIVPSIHDAEVHAAIQSSAAVEYAVRKGIELRVFNVEGSAETVRQQATGYLRSAVSS